MQGIEFEEEEKLIAPKIPVAQNSVFVWVFQKMGVSSKSAQNIILITIAVAFFGIAIFLITKNVPSFNNHIDVNLIKYPPTK